MWKVEPGDNRNGVGCDPEISDVKRKRKEERRKGAQGLIVRPLASWTCVLKLQASPRLRPL